jgi:endogenous inhibitor of DNA gyrase (YacG/DUF329 family)
MSHKKKLPNVRCPRCGKKSDWYDNLFRPFCSERCQLLDLGAWADDQYRIAGPPLPEDDLEGKSGGEEETAEE